MLTADIVQTAIDLFVLWPFFHGLGNDSCLLLLFLSWHHLFNPYTPRFSINNGETQPGPACNADCFCS